MKHRHQLRAGPTPLHNAATTTTCPHSPKEPSRAGVDPALPRDELLQWLGIRLVGRGVLHQPGPFAPGSLVGLGRVGRAPDDGGEWVFPIRDFQPLPAPGLVDANQVAQQDSM